MKHITVKRFDKGYEIAFCVMQVDVEKKQWEITLWHVSKMYQRKGLGTDMLKEVIKKALDEYGMPDEINYIWNGKNKYVKEFLDRHFSPVEPFRVGKVPEGLQEDDYYYHSYHLNVQKVIEFAN